MILQKLFIQNYRCFGEDPAVINFAETGLTAFVGSNNSGKSTALKALEILLGDKWPSGQFSEDDFYNKQHDRIITIACEFGEKVDVDYYGSKIQAVGAVIEVRYIETGYAQSATDVSFNLLSNINDFSVADWEIATNKYKNPINISQEIKNTLPLAITIPLIKLHSEQPANKWGVLGRMMQKVENAFSSDAAQQESFKEKIADAVEILRQPPQFVQLEKDIKHFWESVRPSNLSGTALEFLDYDPWHYYRQFRLAITKNNTDVPLDSLGEGVQRLAVIALYRSYLKNHSRNQKAVLLIEEPESYLHPQARNIVFETLRKAIEGEDVEGHIIYTTHSSDFIDCGFFQELVLFSETLEGSVVRQVNEDNLKKQTEALSGIPAKDQIPPNIYYRLVEADSYGLKDALFSDKALVVEGSSELEFFKAFAKTEKDQISIVVARGKENIPAIYSFLTAFGVPTLISIDRDTSDGSRKGTNEPIVALVNHTYINNRDASWKAISVEKIDKMAEGKCSSRENLMVFSKDLEDCLQNSITEYSALDAEIKKTIGSSKPKCIFALGLICKGKISNIKLTEKQEKDVQVLSDYLKKFLAQSVARPNMIE